MNVIKRGSRGTAVEDIQRRLTYLGHTLGKTGVDGVFLEDTVVALTEFQQAMGLVPSGEVDALTWSVLVDSTFSFGDRTLYLRHPAFHGQDIVVLQTALNSLGFTAGKIDGIFGIFTEHAVIEFQKNLGLAPDGVVGFSTLSAIEGLKHMWENKEIISHSAAIGAPTHRAAVLNNIALYIEADDRQSLQIARRIENLALASCEQAEVFIVQGDQTNKLEPKPGKTVVSFKLISEKLEDESLKLEEVSLGTSLKVPLALIELTFDRGDFWANLNEIVSQDLYGSFVVKIPANLFEQGSQQGFQNAAVYILDALCEAFSHLR